MLTFLIADFSASDRAIIILNIYRMSSGNRTSSKAVPVKAAVMTYITKNAQWPGKNTQLYIKNKTKNVNINDRLETF